MYSDIIVRSGMLRCIPDLAGRLAAAGQLSAESKLEQKAAGLDELSAEEKRQLQIFNQRYKYHSHSYIVRIAGNSISLSTNLIDNEMLLTAILFNV